MRYTTEDGQLELMVPATWQVSETNDDTLPVVVADPNSELVVMITAEPMEPSENDLDFEALMAAVDEELGRDALADLVGILLDMVDMDIGDLLTDDSMTDVFPSASGVTIRLAGTTDLEEFALPVVLYVDIRPEDYVGLIALGDLDIALNQEEALLEILDSVVMLP
jgi:hypothetical protein